MVRGARTKLLLLPATILLIFLPAIAGAQALYGIDSNGNQLLTIDPSTGVASVVGPLGFSAGGGSAAFAGGTLYGLISDGSDGGQDKLFTIDTTTGAATEVVDVDQDVAGRGMHFSPDNATVYYTDGDEFWTMDPATGVSTLVGTMSGVAVQMARDDDGIYYVIHSNALYTLDPATAATTQVASIGVAGAGLSWNPTDGRLYTVSNQNLYSIDPVTGSATLIGPVGFHCTGLAFDYGPVAAEEATWGGLKSRYRK